MSDRDALYAAVLAAPADDLPRLLYADWCDDHGEPDRAEFIRVQCELARLPAADARRGPLVDRAAELLTPDARVRWGILESGLVQGFRRGFVESIYTNAERFLRSGDGLFRQAPVRELRLSVADQFVTQLCRVGGLARVHALDLSGNMLGVNGRLNQLLTTAPLDSLRRLTVRDNRLFADAVGQIASTPVAPRLTALNLSGNPLSDDGLEALAGAARLGGLRTLTVRNDEQSFEDSVHAAGAAALRASYCFPALKQLDLSGHHVGDAGLMHLIESCIGQGLDVLRLARNDIGETGDDWAVQLTDPARRAVPRLLDLSGRRNAVGPLAAQELAGWSKLDDGVTVDLRGCAMDRASHALLSRSDRAARLLIDPDPPDEDEP